MPPNVQQPVLTTPPADRAAMASALLLEQLIRLVYPERSPQDMHPGQWATLRFLARANPDAATVVGVSRYLGITLGPASRAVASLVRKELVSGTPDLKDRRVTRLALTATGTALMAHDPLQRLGGLITQLGPIERSALASAIDHLFVGLREIPGSEASAPFVVPHSLDVDSAA
jgi:DNA-binding MarR family transcriptional regulator